MDRQPRRSRPPAAEGVPEEQQVRGVGADIAAGADFSSASSDFRALGAFFCNSCHFRLCHPSALRAHGELRARTTSCGLEPSETIPFSGADSILSIRCGAISGRLGLAVSPLAPQSRRTERPRLKKSTISLGDFRQGGVSRLSRAVMASAPATRDT
jgi:hypothetical protein